MGIGGCDVTGPLDPFFAADIADVGDAIGISLAGAAVVSWAGSGCRPSADRSGAGGKGACGTRDRSTSYRTPEALNPASSHA